MYPGEKEHVAYQEYVLDHTMGDAPSTKAGKRMTKDEWRAYTAKGANKMAGKKKPPSKPNAMQGIHAR